MNVNGIEIDDAILERAKTYFPEERSFTAADLTSALVRLGVVDKAAYRAADRLLQKWRKQGTHVFSGGKWRARRERAAS